MSIMSHCLTCWVTCVSALLSLLTFASLVSSETYYVTPNNDPCPSEPCFNISQYAGMPKGYFSLNTTMILLPGNHTLKCNLSFTNLSELSIVANKKNSTISCTASAMLSVEHIDKVQISGVALLQCVGNNVSSVNHFELNGCHLYGQGALGIGLMLSNVVNGIITGSSFLSLRSSSGYGGGALNISANSNVSISNCLFDHNVATGGGAVYSESAIVIDNTTFSNNVANVSFGGALYAHNALGNTEIINSTFVNNSASQNPDSCCVGGGAVTFVNSVPRKACQSKLSITDSVFENNSAYSFGAGAIGVYLTAVSIVRSSIVHNLANITNGGGVIVESCGISIEDTYFSSNIAASLGGALSTGNGLLNISIRNSDFSGNTATFGGGAIALNNNRNVSIHKTNFTHNRADRGSVLYIRGGSTLSIFGSVMQSNTAVLAGSLFVVGSSLCLYGSSVLTENVGSLFAIASNISLSGHTKMFNNSYISSNGRFEGGGAITAVQSEVIFNNVTELTNNKAGNGSGGAILLSESTLSVNGDVTIKDNLAHSGGGIFVYQSELNIQGSSCLLMNNTAKDGGGIYAASSSINLINGSLHFSGNLADRGGGVFLESGSKVYVMKHSYDCRDPESGIYCGNQNRQLNFTGNTAEYKGGAIYVTDEASSGLCATDSSSPVLQSKGSSECFFQSLALYSNPIIDSPRIAGNINLINTNFVGNTVVNGSGATLFGGLLDRCIVSPFSEIFVKYFDLQYIPAYDSFAYYRNITQGNVSTSDVSSYPVRVCFCKWEGGGWHHNCSYTPNTGYIMKGKPIKVRIVAVDQVNNTVPAIIHSYITSPVEGLGPRQSKQKSSGSCGTLTLNITVPSSNAYDFAQLNFYAEGPCKDSGVSKTSLGVRFLPCQCAVGLVPQASNCDCGCDPRLLPYITRCFNANGTLLREGDFWVDSVLTNHGNSGFVIAPHCPFDYCFPPTTKVYLNLSNPRGADKQCAFNRSGKLCGSCADGLSLSLGNSHCILCSSKGLALIILFAVAGVALVAFLLACNLTVAVGTINGLIFYANILAANHAIFLPTDTPRVFVVFIAWINLDLGVETCFYDGMDAYVYSWLQTIFPIYLIFLVGMTIFISEHSQRFARLLSGKNPVATLATLILLSYTKLLRTIVTALSFTRLEYPDGSVETVWLYDANIKYFSGKHVPLFMVATSILLVGIVYTLFLFLWKWRRYTTLGWVRNTKIYSFMDAYTAPFSYKHSYWTGLFLLIRGILYLISALNVFGDPRVNLLSIICILGTLNVYKELVSVSIYTKWSLNALESAHLFNLLLFAVGTLYIQETNGNQYALSCVSVGVVCLIFLGIVFYHTFAFTFPGVTQRVKKLFQRSRTTSVDERSKLITYESSYLQPTSAAELRKPLDLIDDSDEETQGQIQPIHLPPPGVTHTVIEGIRKVN